MLRRHFHRFCVAGMALAGLPAAALAAGYPEKPIQLIVPFPAGGSLDGVVRTMQNKLSEQLGQTLVIENVGGAGGAIGASRVARSAPDGYTLLVGTINDIALAPTLNPALKYSPLDFTPITVGATNTAALVARGDLPYQNIGEVLEALRSKPGSLTYGSPGVGTFQHLVAEEVQARGGVEAVHVPYRGAAPLLTDLLGGQIDLAVLVPSTVVPYAENGRLKVLGLASEERVAEWPQLPVLGENADLKGLVINGWLGFLAPAGLDSAKVAVLREAIEATLADPVVAEALVKNGFQAPTEAERADFGALIARDVALAERYKDKVQ